MARIDPGWGYVAQSQRYPHIIKVGKTRQRVGKRMLQLDDDPMYGAFKPWRCVALVYSRQHSEMEARAHRKLRRYRYRYGTCMELFQTSTIEAHKALLRYQDMTGEKRSLGFGWFLLGVILFIIIAMGAMQ